MDKNEALFWVLLSIGLVWVAFPTSLILSQEYASMYGQQVLVYSSCGSLLAGGIAVLVYAFWDRSPPSRMAAAYRYVPSQLKKETTQQETKLPPSLLNKLERLHASLVDGPTVAVSWFESNIERTGYVKALRDLSPMIVIYFNVLRLKVNELENASATEEEARELLGNAEYERSRTYNTLKTDLFLARIRNDAELPMFVNQLKKEIQDLISKLH